MKTFLVFCSLIILLQQPGTWNAPKDADNLKNPVKADAASVKEGQSLFTKQCVMCHGIKGMGDGPTSISLTPKPGNLLAPKAQKLTDGALFWKITNGKAPMPTFKATLTETQRWQIVNYIRELDKKYNTHK